MEDSTIDVVYRIKMGLCNSINYCINLSRWLSSRHYYGDKTVEHTWYTTMNY